MADDLVTARLDRLEREVAELRRELARVRDHDTLAPSAATTETAGVSVRAAPPAAAPERPSAPVAHESLDASLTAAWRQLERGQASSALDSAFAALALIRSRVDLPALDELAALASVAMSNTSGRTQSRAKQLALRIEMTRRTLTGAPVTAPPPPPHPAPVASPAPPPAAPVPSAPPEPVEPEPTVSERVSAWLKAELTGARAFAIVGGAVTLLGVVFLFVLAANRGWVGPVARVALGATASLVVLVAGLALRMRYGRVNAALGAVGAGIAGAYATLAAATILYGYLPAWGALLVAAGIAGVGAAIAIAWSSQILAGLALVGAAVAPGLVALDDGISWPGPAFALVVAAATVGVASRRRWLWLDVAVVGVAVAQVLWLVADAPQEDAGSVGVACVAAFVLLAAAIARQAYGDPGLSAATSGFAFAAGGMALYGPTVLVPDDRRLGALLFGLALAFTGVALAVRRWRDLAWVVAAMALLLGGVATAFILSGRSLTVVWAVEAALLAALAWKLRMPRFQAASLAYVVAAAVQSLVIEIVPEWPTDAFDVPKGAAAGLFVLAAGALVTGLLQPESKADPPSLGIAAALEPLWDGLVRARVAIRAVLAVGAAVALGMALAAVLSGRALTIVLAGLAVALAVAAFTLGERRLQPFALAFLGYATVHALSVEAPPDTLAVERDAAIDPLAAVPSLVALSIAAALLAALARFDDRGIHRLGPLSGPELHLALLRRGETEVRRVLGMAAVSAAVWAAGLVAIDVSFSTGQVVATALWALTGGSVVLLGARVRSGPWQAVGFVYVLLALAKAGLLDWEHLGDAAAAVSLLVVASALFVSGFVTRWVDQVEESPVEIVSLATAAIAAVLAIVALERLLGIDSRALGVASLGVAFVAALTGTLPYRRWRAGREEPWLRLLANGYWAVALGALLFSESAVTLRDDEATLVLWAMTAALLAVVWRPLAEDRLWMAALPLAGVAAVGALCLVTVPDALLQASRHPAAGIWVLAIVTGTAWVVAATTPPPLRELAPWLLGVAAALSLYGLSLCVLEAVEWVSGASVKTDFQRGHTVLSALWGVGALALYVVGLARDRRDLRLVGLALFGVALAKLFLYDLRSLSSVTRAFSFLAVGAILLAAGFFAERLVRPEGDEPPGPSSS